MPKSDKPKRSKVVSKEELARAKALAKFDELSEKALKYIAECQDAMLPCTYCQTTKEGAVYAAKYDENKKCIKCHGTGLVPDRETRKWATDEITARAAPKPKAVEMEFDDKREVTEWEQLAETLPDDKLNALAKELGIVFDEPGAE